MGWGVRVYVYVRDWRRGGGWLPDRMKEAIDEIIEGWLVEMKDERFLESTYDMPRKKSSNR